jgi:hypothetical protein
MSALAVLTNLVGKWQGTNQLWLSPEEPVRESESSAVIRTLAQGQFSEMQYSWADEGHPQEGRLILGQITGKKTIEAVWFDTWHMREEFMVCEGEIDEDGVVVSVQGTYAAPSGPDWGWEITIEPGDKNAFRFLMYNISPEGEKMLAVEVKYRRQA